MRRSLEEIVSRIVHFVTTWETLRPHKSFSGLTLEQFKREVQPALDIDAHIEGLDVQREAAFAIRAREFPRAMKLCDRIGWAVIGDREEGSNGQFYGALGYVRDSERKSGLVRKRKKE